MKPVILLISLLTALSFSQQEAEAITTVKSRVGEKCIENRGQRALRQRIAPSLPYSNDDLIIIQSRESLVVYLENGEAEVQFFFTVVQNQSEIEITAFDTSSSDGRILQSSDVDIIQSSTDLTDYQNFTGIVYFNRQVGRVLLNIALYNSKRAVVKQVRFFFLVCGLSFFVVKNEQAVFVTDGTAIIGRDSSFQDDEELLFLLKVQFPDQTYDSDGKDILNSNFKDLVISKSNYSNENQQMYCMYEGLTILVDGSYKLRNGCFYGLRVSIQSADVYFGVSLTSLSDSNFSFNFEWENFSSNDTRYVYETVLNVHITSDSLPSIQSMSPALPFRRKGGDLLFCDVSPYLSNDLFKFFLRNETILPIAVDKISAAVIRLTFVMPPGKGENVEWNLALKRETLEGEYICPWNGEGPRYELSYLPTDIFLASVDPAKGPGRGGISVICRGFFGDSDIQEFAVYFGGAQLPLQNILRRDSTELVFRLPPYISSIFGGRIVDLQIQVESTRSNVFIFEYVLPRDIVLHIPNAEYNAGSNSFSVIRCNPISGPDSTQNITIRSWIDPKFEETKIIHTWTILDLNRERKEHVLLRDKLGYASFVLSKVVQDSYFIVRLVLEDSAQKYSEVKELTFGFQFKPFVSFSIAAPVQNPIYFAPEAPVFFTSFPDFDQSCASSSDSQKLHFSWSYATQNYSTISASSETPKKITLHKYGASLFIPHGSLRVGLQNVTMSVASRTFSKSVSITSFLHVLPHALNVVINGGENYVVRSTQNTLSMTGLNTLLNYGTEEREKMFSFKWSCELWLGTPQFGFPAKCPEQIFKAEHSESASFAISASQLQNIQLYNRSIFAVYDLHVFSSSPGDDQILEVHGHSSQIVQLVDHALPAQEGLKVQLSYGERNVTDFNNVEYFKRISVFIETSSLFPITIELQAFAKNQSLFSDSTGKLSLRSSKTNSRQVADIPAFTMESNQSYTLSIVSELNNETASVLSEYVFKTILEPELLSLNVEPHIGTIDTQFEVTVSMSPNSPYFRVFVLVHSSSFPKMCADDCSGLDNFKFIIPVVGIFQLTVLVTSYDGVLIMEENRDDWELEIKANESKKLDVEAEIRQFQADMSYYEMQGSPSPFLKSAVAFGIYCRGLRQLADHDWDQIAEVISATISGIMQLFKQTIILTTTGQDYITATNIFASLGSSDVMFLNEEMVSSLIAASVFIINNTLSENYFNLSATLNSTLTLLSSSLFQKVVEGSSRKRLQISPGEVNTAMLDFGEVIVPLWSKVQFRNSPCGSKWNDWVGSIARIHGGSYCAMSEENGISGQVSELRWCSAVFDGFAGDYLYATLAEFQNDYVFKSGVQTLALDGDSTLSDSVVDIKINTSLSETHGKALLRGILAGHNAKNIEQSNCIQVRQEYRRPEELFVGVDGVVQCSNISSFEYINRKTLSTALAPNAYARKTIETISDGLSTSGSIVSLAKSNALYGVQWIDCLLKRAKVRGLMGGIWIVAVTILLVLFLTTSGILLARKVMSDPVSGTHYYSDNAFIDRDNYGRGDQGREIE